MFYRLLNAWMNTIFLLQETLRVLSPLVTVVTVVRISFVNTCVAYINLHIFKTVPKINRIYSFILLCIVIYSDQLLFQNWEKEKEAHRLWRSPEKPSHYIDMSESHVKIFTFCGSFIYEHEEGGGMYRDQRNLRLSTP